MGLGGTLFAGFIGATALGISIISYPFVAPALRRVCIPFVPASSIQVKNVLKLLENCPKPLAPVIDLGSGDGRIVSNLFRDLFQIGASINNKL
jgi:hypothetical protein